MMILQKNRGVSSYLEVCDVAFPDNYEMKMLINNELEYIPPAEIRELDGSRSMYVRVDGLGTLAGKYGKCIPEMEDVKRLVRDIGRCLEEIGNYLLSPDSLVLSFRYIMYDSDRGTCKFIYVPGMVKPFKDQLKELFEEIMVVFDHKDRQGVGYLYDLYSRFLQENFTPHMFRCLVEEKSDRSSDRVQADRVEEQPMETADESELCEDEPQIRRSKVSIYIMSGIAGIIITIVLLVLFGVASLKFSSLMLIGLIIFIVNDVIRTRDENDMDEAMQLHYERKQQRAEAGRSTEPEEAVRRLVQIVEEDPGTEILSDAVRSDGIMRLKSCDSGEDILLIEGETRVGRKKTLCDFYLDNPSVSRVHAVFEKHGGILMVRDAGSTNGTYVNDIRVSGDESVEAKKGDYISIADVRYECC